MLSPQVAALRPARSGRESPCEERLKDPRNEDPQGREEDDPLSRTSVSGLGCVPGAAARRFSGALARSRTRHASKKSGATAGVGTSRGRTFFSFCVLMLFSFPVPRFSKNIFHKLETASWHGKKCCQSFRRGTRRAREPRCNAGPSALLSCAFAPRLKESRTRMGI